MDVQTGQMLVLRCPPDAYATSDPRLEAEGDGFKDMASDQPASAANTLTYSLNATRCLASQGKSWDSGQEFSLQISGRDPKGDQAEQVVNFKRP